MFRIHGVSPDDPDLDIHALVAEIIHPEDRDAVLHAFEHAVATHTHLALQTRVVLRNGDDREVSVRGRVECDEGGAPVRMRGTTHEVTDPTAMQRQASRDARDQQRQLETERGVYDFSELDSLTDAVFAELREMFALDRAMVCLVDEEGANANAFWAFGFGDASLSEIAIDLAQPSPVTQVVHTGEPALLVVDRRQEDAPDAFGRRFDLNGSWAVLPLRVRDRAMGVLGLHRLAADGPRPPFTADDVERMSPFVNELALAIDNAHLHRQLQTQAVWLKGVVTAARCILWQGEVEERDGKCHWDLAPADERAAQRLFPVDLRPGESRVGATARAVVPAERDRMDRQGADAIQAGESAYSQEYRATNKHGETRWLSEDVHVQALAPGRWRVTGVTTDITDRKEDQLLREALFEIAETGHTSTDLAEMCRGIYRAIADFMDRSGSSWHW